MQGVTDAPRFFARVLSFDCECPACGTILQARTFAPGAQTAGQGMRARHRLIWNPITGRLRCPSCQRVYATGLLIYQVDPADRTPGRPPADHVPDARQRADLRALARPREGRKLAGLVRGGDPTNRALEAVCACPEGGWSAVCPVHPDYRAPGRRGRAAVKPLGGSEDGKGD